MNNYLLYGIHLQEQVFSNNSLGYHFHSEAKYNKKASLM